jgi:hypothetical protein
VKQPWVVNVVITALGLTLFAGLNARTGRLDANDGLGWDGRQYAHMVTGGLKDGTASTQTRPLLPLLTRIPYKAGLDIIPAFQWMNFVYAAVLYFFLCLILDHYGTAPAYKAYFVATVALCISTSKMFAFYPVQVDLGALALMTAATFVVLTRTGWPAGAAVLLAVTAREFAAAVALFGFHRELRQGIGLRRATLTYAPAVAVMFLLRNWARATNVGDRRRPLATFEEIFAGFALALDPAFIAFFLYFMVTLLGGVVLVLLLRPVWTVRQLIAAPELATLAIPIVAAAAVGSDIWRYGVFLLPALAILFGAYARAHRPGILVLAAALLFTLATQQPFVPMDMVQYFRDWFPVYLHRAGDVNDQFWAIWNRRFAVATVLAVATGLLLWIELRRQARSVPDPLARRPMKRAGP